MFNQTHGMRVNGRECRVECNILKEHRIVRLSQLSVDLRSGDDRTSNLEAHVIDNSASADGAD